MRFIITPVTTPSTTDLKTGAIIPPAHATHQLADGSYVCVANFPDTGMIRTTRTIYTAVSLTAFEEGQKLTPCRPAGVVTASQLAGARQAKIEALLVAGVTVPDPVTDGAMFALPVAPDGNAVDALHQLSTMILMALSAQAVAPTTALSQAATPVIDTTGAAHDMTVAQFGRTMLVYGQGVLVLRARLAAVAAATTLEAITAA